MSEIWRLLGRDRVAADVAGWTFAFMEWSTTWLLLQRDGRIWKEDLRAAYDGSLFWRIEEENRKGQGWRQGFGWVEGWDLGCAWIAVWWTSLVAGIAEWWTGVVMSVKHSWKGNKAKADPQSFTAKTKSTLTEKPDTIATTLI